jgi:hypothetical protein
MIMVSLAVFNLPGTNYDIIGPENGEVNRIEIKFIQRLLLLIIT